MALLSQIGAEVWGRGIPATYQETVQEVGPALVKLTCGYLPPIGGRSIRSSDFSGCLSAQRTVTDAFRA